MHRSGAGVKETKDEKCEGRNFFSLQWVVPLFQMWHAYKRWLNICITENLFFYLFGATSVQINATHTHHHTYWAETPPSLPPPPSTRLLLHAGKTSLCTYYKMFVVLCFLELIHKESLVTLALFTILSQCRGTAVWAEQPGAGGNAGRKMHTLTTERFVPCLLI